MLHAAQHPILCDSAADFPGLCSLMPIQASTPALILLQQEVTICCALALKHTGMSQPLLRMPIPRALTIESPAPWPTPGPRMLSYRIYVCSLCNLSLGSFPIKAIGPAGVVKLKEGVVVVGST